MKSGDYISTLITCIVFIVCLLWTGDSANAVPPTKKLRTRVTRIWGDRRGQPNRSAMERPRPGRTSFVINVPPVPGKYADTGPLGPSRHRQQSPSRGQQPCINTRYTPSFAWKLNSHSALSGATCANPSLAANPASRQHRSRVQRWNATGELRVPTTVRGDNRTVFNHGTQPTWSRNNENVPKMVQNCPLNWKSPPPEFHPYRQPLENQLVRQPTDKIFTKHDKNRK